jgi:hypothetical protein
VKTICKFLSTLVLLSLLAYPTVSWFETAYRGILQLGIADSASIHYVGVRVFYPFLVLVLATPRLGLRRKAAGIAAGLFLYLLIDRLMIPVWKILPYTQKPGPVAAKEFYTNVYYMIMTWMLPFLLWIVIAFRQIEQICNGDSQGVMNDEQQNKADYLSL